MKYLQLYIAGLFVLWAGYSFYNGDHPTAYWMLFYAILNAAIWCFIFRFIFRKRPVRKDTEDLEMRVLRLEAEVNILSTVSRHRDKIDFDTAVALRKRDNDIVDKYIKVDIDKYSIQGMYCMTTPERNEVKAGLGVVDV